MNTEPKELLERLGTKMDCYAYAVMEIDRKTLKVVHVGIYSEEHPTSRYHTIALFSVNDRSYEKAHDEIADILTNNAAYEWLAPVYRGGLK